MLAIFAHPDDETVMMGGTLARYAAAGVRVALLCATRGEYGPISDPALATEETLPAVREAELRAACKVLGVGWLRFLDCPDSGVNNLWWPEVEAKIVRAIRELKPQVIVTFGLDGLYGHPDHIAVSMLARAAFRSAGQAECFAGTGAPHQAQKLYYAQFPYSLAQDLLESLRVEAGAADFWGFDPEAFGVADEEITATLDVAEYVPAKLRALRCHRTQLVANNVFALINDDLAARLWAREHFRLADTVGPASDAGPETDLFAGLFVKRLRHAY